MIFGDAKCASPTPFPSICRHINEGLINTHCEQYKWSPIVNSTNGDRQILFFLKNISDKGHIKCKDSETQWTTGQGVSLLERPVGVRPCRDVPLMK
jgi:hypothetical protein